MTLAERIKEALGEAVLEIDQPLPNRIYVYVRPEKIVAAARGVYDGLGARFVIMTGLEEHTGFEVLYHFCLDSEGTVVTLKIKLPGDFPEVDSIGPVLSGALWIEREITDLLGISFRGHPDMRRLVLSDDWPEGIHPLRRKYKL
ncbi:MAG: NADH-quinone oxidoreductase subunit C [Planctomycetota bacterium]|jgi:Ni,Fe-hydrogenase III component G